VPNSKSPTTLPSHTTTVRHKEGLLASLAECLVQRSRLEINLIMYHALFIRCFLCAQYFERKKIQRQAAVKSGVDFGAIKHVEGREQGTRARRITWLLASRRPNAKNQALSLGIMLDQNLMCVWARRHDANQTCGHICSQPSFCSRPTYILTQNELCVACHVCDH
jgi:hypothetical protein